MNKLLVVAAIAGLSGCASHNQHIPDPSHDIAVFWGTANLGNSGKHIEVSDEFMPEYSYTREYKAWSLTSSTAYSQAHPEDNPYPLPIYTNEARWISYKTDGAALVVSLTTAQGSNGSGKGTIKNGYCYDSKELKAGSDLYTATLLYKCTDNLNIDYYIKIKENRKS